VSALEHGAGTEAGATRGWLDRYDAAVAPVVPSYFDVVADHAQGSWITDVEGRRLLDLGSGIGVTNVGHRHPRVQAAIAAQLDRLWHTSVVVRHQGYIELAERIGALCPFFVEPRTFLCNTGAEAVDGAIKLARHVTGRAGVVAFRQAFHGRTLGATSLTTAKGSYRAGYEPLLPSVHVAPYCLPGPAGSGLPAPEAAEAALTELDRILDLQAPPADVAAMVVEPVLGEGGYVAPPVGWLEGLRGRCDRHGILLVFDEVQCGMGRTGHPFAAETFGVTPDVVLFAKGVASGLPLGGIVAPAAVMDRWPKGAHGSTFGGNPLSCAAALATLDVLEQEGCYERATQIGATVRDRLGPMVGSSVVEVRGVGAMIGVQLPSPDAAAEVQQRCLRDGVIVLTCGPKADVLRLIPPLTITDDELAQGLEVLVAALG
jgi:4-aminobutyrate aminotransferase